MAGIEVISFHHLQDIVDRYLIQPDPFLIYYTVTYVIHDGSSPLLNGCSIDAANPSNSRTFDLEIETEDTAYKSSLTASATKVNSGYTSQIVALDDEVRPLPCLTFQHFTHSLIADRQRCPSPA
jgi:hypothetical protein